MVPVPSIATVVIVQTSAVEVRPARGGSQGRRASCLPTAERAARGGILQVGPVRFADNLFVERLGGAVVLLPLRRLELGGQDCIGVFGRTAAGGRCSPITSG